MFWNKLEFILIYYSNYRRIKWDDMLMDQMKLVYFSDLNKCKDATA